jgi:hypothetical protein
MAQDHRGTAVSSPAAAKPVHSTAAERMRMHRQRRRRGVLCFRIELTENVINELIRRKRLIADYRADPNAVGEALCNNTLNTRCGDAQRGLRGYAVARHYHGAQSAGR